MNLWPVEHFGVPLVLQIPQSEEKEMVDWSEVHLSEMTSYKIHTLVRR